MTKIQHHHPKRPARPVETPQEKPRPANPKPESPTSGTVDHFLKEVAAAVYQNHPLVMLCTQPQIRAVAAKVPVIKDVADAVCPIVRGTK